MEQASKAILIFLLNKRYIGGKHFPEDKLIVSRTKWLDKLQKKTFEEEYRNLLNNQFIIKLKKRTGKGSEWHISLNPRKLGEIYELINNEKN